MSERRIIFQGDHLWMGAGELPELKAEVSLSLPEGVLVERVADTEPRPEGVEALGLREAFERLEPEAWALAGRAYQWLEWEAGHRFCGGCATELEPGEGYSLECPDCGITVFPSNATAVIVLIGRGEGPDRQWALARSPHFKTGVYSAVAGFTEPGESLEQAVHREVAEELGIRVHHLRYFGSQPWPFPNGLMVAFTADYLDGDLKANPAELEDARWFSRHDLPLLPSALSIARWMLDAAVAELERN